MAISLGILENYAGMHPYPQRMKEDVPALSFLLLGSRFRVNMEQEKVRNSQEEWNNWNKIT